MFFMVVRTGGPALRALICAFAILCAGAGQGTAAASADGKPTLLLLPIVVHSSEDPEYLRNGLSDMLSARFSRIGALQLLRNDDPEAATTDLEKALALGRAAGADYVLYGSFTRFGQGASLDVQCSPTDESKARAPLREIFVHSGSIGEIIPDLDELAGKVSRFALGELVPATSPASAGFAAPAGPGIQELIGRVEALEAAITELLETDIVDESIEDLR